ncbi:MAG: peptidase C69, partial [Pyramidobacter porci]|nr:peptidase C69 [Pyramidobacter porci]
TPMVQDKAAELIKAGKRDEAVSLITDFAYANAVDFNQRWQTLGDVLLGKYALGYVNFKTTPYPQEWNDFIGYGPITRPAK